MPEEQVIYKTQRRSILPGMIVAGGIVSALGYGMFQFLQGKNQRAANRAMLWRVGLQGGGVVGLFLLVQVYEGPFVQGLLHDWRSTTPVEEIAAPPSQKLL